MIDIINLTIIGWDFFTTFSNNSGLLFKIVLLLTKRNACSHKISFCLREEKVSIKETN